MFRVPFLVPRIGARWVELPEMPIMRLGSTSPLLTCCVDTPDGSNESVHQTLFRHIELDRDMYAVFKGPPHYERTAEFVALCDIPTFDPAAEAPSLSHFVPMLRRLIAAPKQWIYKAAMGPGAVRA